MSHLNSIGKCLCLPAPCRYDFLYRLAEQYGDSSAALLPNFVYSQALARWFQEQGGLS